MNKTKVLIADDNEIALSLLQEFIAEEKDFEIVAIAKEGKETLSKIYETKPDIVLLDIIMPELGGLDVLSHVMNDHDFNDKPLFIMQSVIGSEHIADEAFLNGAFDYVMKPLSYEQVISHLHRAVAHREHKNIRKDFITKNPYLKDDIDLKSEVTEILHQVGLPAHLAGYELIRQGIIMSFNDPKLIDSITKGLYPALAKKTNSSPSRVERSFRHAIEVAWGRGNTAIMEEIFGYTIDFKKGKPTNSEFIALITDNLRIKSRYW